MVRQWSSQRGRQKPGHSALDFSYWDFDEFSSNFIRWHLKEITLVATQGIDRRWTKMETYSGS